MATPHDAGAPTMPGAGDPLRLESVRCCICDHDEAVPIGVGEDFEYRTSPDTFLAMRCRECGLIYLKLRPADTEFDRIYPPSYHAFDFTGARFGLAHRVRRGLETRRLRTVCQALPRGARVLDVGCGDGFHLELLREYGGPDWILEGIDASARAVAAARARGLTVHQGTIQDASVPVAAYDLVLLIATIEHVSDPVSVLRAAADRLRPDGRMLVVTDNTDTRSFRLAARRYWGGYHFPRHWNLFDARSFHRLAARAELEVETIATLMTPVNWLYSIHNALVDWGAPRWLVNRFTLRSPGSLAVFTIVDALEQLGGHGGLLRVVLRRPRVRPTGEGNRDDGD